MRNWGAWTRIFRPSRRSRDNAATESGYAGEHTVATGEADHNRAERELRPTVTARKVSFGSQSDAGAKTREVLMSVVQTLAKRVPDPESHFKLVLNQLAADPTQDPVALLLNPG